MVQARDVPSRCDHGRHFRVDLAIDILFRLLQRALVQPPPDDEIPAVVLADLQYVHAGLYLEGVHAVEPQLNEDGDEFIDPAVGIDHEEGNTVRAEVFQHALVGFHHEAPEELRRDQ